MARLDLKILLSFVYASLLLKFFPISSFCPTRPEDNGSADAYQNGVQVGFGLTSFWVLEWLWLSVVLLFFIRRLSIELTTGHARWDDLIRGVLPSISRGACRRTKHCPDSRCSRAN